ncbi:MAG: NAD(+)/NADH kinase [Lachnospiraceae bacterium]|nr:NAD(+)/NADH kinase [Lachnospiraceae bacterium]
MERFCVITNSSKENAERVAAYIKAFLEREGKSCLITKDRPNRPGNYTNINEIPQDTECAIVVGGDGTLIQAAVDLKDWDLLLVGVNLGTLGYLTEVEEHNIDQALTRLVHDDFQIEHRMMMSGQVRCLDGWSYQEYSLNDIIISRSGFCGMILVKVYLNGALIDTFDGDGVLVCTPTGSTGYNLSAGGPVMAPQSQMFTITPICPHSLNKRSFVVSAQDVVTLEMCERKPGKDEAVISFDGRLKKEIQVGERVDIEIAPQVTKLIKLTDLSFFDILRSKLN